MDLSVAWDRGGPCQLGLLVPKEQAFPSPGSWAFWELSLLFPVWLSPSLPPLSPSSTAVLPSPAHLPLVHSLRDGPEGHLYTKEAQPCHLPESLWSQAKEGNLTGPRSHPHDCRPSATTARPVAPGQTCSWPSMFLLPEPCCLSFPNCYKSSGSETAIRQGT